MTEMDANRVREIASGSHIIGIDYNASGFERGYAHVLIRWIALQVGRKRRRFPDRMFNNKPVPYYLYDEQATPILLDDPREVAEDFRWACVDRFGTPVGPPGSSDFETAASFMIPDLWTKAHAKALKKHKLKPDQWPCGRDNDKLHWAVVDSRKEAMWPQVKPLIEKVRVEMKRLDEAWASFTP